MSRPLVVCLEDERLELIQAVVYSGPSFLFHDGLVALSLERLLAHLFHFQVHSHVGLCVCLCMVAKLK